MKYDFKLNQLEPNSALTFTLRVRCSGIHLLSLDFKLPAKN